jgi:large subunit ribosomal protein L37Ae
MSHKRSKSSSAGGLGARYGRSVRSKIARIQTEAHVNYLCSSCGSLKVERSSVGVWKCKKCGNTFAGGAYTPTTKTGDVANRSVK